MPKKLAVRRRLPLLLALAALIVCCCAFAPGTAAARKPPCSAKHAHTLASTHRARVFSINGRFYGCLRRSGRTTLLTENEAPEDDVFELGVSHMTLDGTWVAWIESSNDASGSSNEIRAEDLRTHRVRAATDDSVDASDTVVVSPHGALAWLAPDLAPSYRIPDFPEGIVPIAGTGPASLAVLGDAGVWTLRDLAHGTLSRATRVASAPGGDIGPGRTLAAADLDGDGAVDLVAPTETGATVVPGRADGTFGPLRALALAGGAEHVAVGDLNRDGHPDVVLCGPRAASIALGRGGFAFAPATPLHVAHPCTAVSIGDATGDGIPDLALDANGFLTLLRDNGDGTFATAFSKPMRHAVELLDAQPQLADVNRDGIADFLFLDDGNRFSAMLGRGGGAFAQPTDGKGFVSAFAVGDVDGDTVPDAVLVVNTHSIEVLHGRGDGTFGNTHVYSTTFDSARVVSLADLDSDGKLDIVVGEQDTREVAVLVNKGDGTFHPWTSAADLYIPHGKQSRELVHAAQIDRRSLRFRGNTLVWRAAGKRASARVR